MPSIGKAAFGRDVDPPDQERERKTARKRKHSREELFDAELADMPEAARWRIWMGRVEAVIFASPHPVTRETLAPLVGQTCVLEDILEDIAQDLKTRPYELAFVAGGYQIRTKALYAGAIRISGVQGIKHSFPELSQTEMMVLADIAYFQPVTRAAISDHLGKDISRDIIARLKQLDLISAGPRVPEPGAPFAYVTTRHFLSLFGINTLRDLPGLDQLREEVLSEGEEAGDVTRALGDTDELDPLADEDETARELDNDDDEESQSRL
jgi:segregation and condensation protein B